MNEVEVVFFLVTSKKCTLKYTFAKSKALKLERTVVPVWAVKSKDDVKASYKGKEDPFLELYRMPKQLPIGSIVDELEDRNRLISELQKECNRNLFLELFRSSTEATGLRMKQIFFMFFVHCKHHHTTIMGAGREVQGGALAPPGISKR